MPDKVDASTIAVIVIFDVPSNKVPLIVLPVCNAVAVPALPVTLPLIGVDTVRLLNVPTDVMAGCADAVTVAADPVTLPLIGAVTVKPVKVPTLVNDEFTTFGASVVPDKVDASATEVMVIFDVPSKDTPLIVLAFCKAVAVAALPVTLPMIGAVTVKPLNVPTDVIFGCATVFNVPVKFVADTVVNPDTVDGNDNVTAPVPADAVIWFAVPVIEVTAPADVK